MPERRGENTRTVEGAGHRRADASSPPCVTGNAADQKQAHDVISKEHCTMIFLLYNFFAN